MFKHLYDKPIAMRGSILGFPDLNEFVLQPIDDSDFISPFAYLQSSEEEGVGFLVTNPFHFRADYELEIGEQEKREIEASAPEDVVVLAIVKIGDPFETSTLNLMAPLIVNVDKLLGRQLVLPPDSPYTTKMTLGSPVKEGER